MEAVAVFSTRSVQGTVVCTQENTSDSTYPLIGGGILMVSNTNKLYTWGRPWAQVSGLKGLARDESLRYPHCINDFYDKRYL